jgi:hypothetical protein
MMIAEFSWGKAQTLLVLNSLQNLTSKCTLADIKVATEE